jgi:hypothetical protein
VGLQSGKSRRRPISLRRSRPATGNPGTDGTFPGFFSADNRGTSRLSPGSGFPEDRLARDQASQERDAWLQSWERYALDALPYNAEAQDKPDLSEAVRARLAGLGPIPDDSATRTPVDAEVRKIVQARKRWRDIEAVLLECRDRTLPAAARGSWSELSDWQVRALRAAGKAISQLRADAPIEEVRAVGKRAVEPVTREFQALQAAKADADLREHLVRWVILPAGLPEQDKETAIQAVRQALVALPQGRPRPRLERAVEEGATPYRAAVAELQAQAEAERQRNRRDAEAERQRNDHAETKRSILVALVTVVPWDAAGMLTPAASPPSPPPSSSP